MNGRFAGRGVIVTGGGRGIGQATARAFAAEGADVLVLGRTVADLEDTVAQITAAGGQAWLLPSDVTDEAQVEETVTRATGRWGRIDVLVNNAGIDDDTPFLEIDRGRWRAVIATNLTGVFLMSQAVGPKLMDYLNGSFARVPIKRLVRTDEVAQAFLFLASDQASAITGIDLRVDGGLTANWYILETLPGD